MQQRLGVAARLLQSFEHQVAGGLVGHGGFEVSGHGLVSGVTGVLLVHHSGHALKSFLHLLFGHHAVQQPVGDVLAGNAQGGAVFHQADVVNVGHLGAAHALVDPAHHIAQNALGVVVQLLLLATDVPYFDFSGGGFSPSISLDCAYVQCAVDLCCDHVGSSFAIGVASSI